MVFASTVRETVVLHKTLGFARFFELPADTRTTPDMSGCAAI